MIVSRSRQLYMNSVSNPAWCAATPSHRRWLWIRSISQKIVRMACARGGTVNTGQLLHPQDVRGGVDVRADPADALHEVDVVDPGPVLRAFLDPAMHVAQADVRVGDDLPVHRQLEMARLLQGGVLRTDGDDERPGRFARCPRRARLPWWPGRNRVRNPFSAGTRSRASRPRGTAASCRGAPRPSRPSSPRALARREQRMAPQRRCWALRDPREAAARGTWPPRAPCRSGTAPRSARRTAPTYSADSEPRDRNRSP